MHEDAAPQARAHRERPVRERQVEHAALSAAKEQQQDRARDDQQRELDPGEAPDAPVGDVEGRVPPPGREQAQEDAERRESGEALLGVEHAHERPERTVFTQWRPVTAALFNGAYSIGMSSIGTELARWRSRCWM